MIEQRRRGTAVLALVAALALAPAANAKPAAKHDAKAAEKSKLAAKSTPAKPTAKATPAKTADVPLPRRRPAATTAVAVRTPAAEPLAIHAPAAELPVLHVPARDTVPLAMSATSSTSSSDLGAVKQALGLIRNSRQSDATELQKTISDPLARKLVEWALLRSDDNGAEFSRYNAFITENPSWPNIITLRRRAEAMLWQERAGSQQCRPYFAKYPPLTGKGRLAFARALLADGDRAGAAVQARAAWRKDSFSHDVETLALDLFGDMLTRADHKARMDVRLYAGDIDAAKREAARLGGVEPALVKARAAVFAKAGNAKALLDAVPAEARHDAGYIYSRAQWLRRQDKIAEAGRLILTAPRDPSLQADLDEWWIERRLIARKLLDIGDAKMAYQVVREAATPPRDNYRVEQLFTAGWIALRFLNEPATAAHYFARISAGTENPISLARAGYWEGRAAEAEHRPQEARHFYAAAARYNTAYYGQLARARLGLPDIALAPAPEAGRRRDVANLEIVRAVEILYALGERDLVVPIAADLSDKTTDQAGLAALADLAARNNDARSVLLIGKTALGRGFPFDHHAFPTVGLPRFTPIGPDIEPAVVYSIARQESAFNPKTVSSANALGLMQVTPAAGRYVAKKFNVGYDESRLLSDTVYNVQIGAAELADVIQRYNGSYIMAFAAYNAGPGRVKEWIGRYGDPRDPKVDPVDWVESIPFSETRNYVQRIMENLQVYRVRFGGGSKLLIEADIHRGAAAAVD